MKISLTPGQMEPDRRWTLMGEAWYYRKCFGA